MASLAGPRAVTPSSPLVSTGSATSIKPTSAVLNGKVNPEGTKTSYQFRWGLTAQYGSQSSFHSAGSGTTSVSVKVTAGSLIPGTKYHYQIIATNQFGTALGKDRTFTTSGHAPPGATTGPPAIVGHQFVILTGTVVPNGQATTAAFQYGIDTNYGATSFGQALASKTAPATISERINGLAPGTIFHYRLVSFHSNSQALGNDAMFMTLPIRRFRPDAVHARTTPHRSRTKPYAFNTTGSITPPKALLAGVACNGTVAVRFFIRHKSVALSLAQVQPNCTYSAQTPFSGLIGHRSRRLRVEVRFRGNGYLGSASPAPQRVRLG
jgi:hypothetical protein